jgi:hypothetical protein
MDSITIKIVKHGTMTTALELKTCENARIK